MTLSLGASVVIYGVVGVYLIRMEKTAPMILKAQTYSIAKYGAFAVAIAGLFLMRQISARVMREFQASSPAERRPQKLLVSTIVMCVAAELPVLLGMILMFLGRQSFDYIPFAILALTGFAFAFPKKQAWSTWLGIDL